MPTKRKFSAKFPTARIKKIMQVDDEIGKLSATVPPVVSRALELFVDQLLTKAYELPLSRSSKTILPSDIKEVIEAESSFAFLKPLVASIPSVKSLEKTTGAKGAKTIQRKWTKRQQNTSDVDAVFEETGPSNSKRNGHRKQPL